MPAGRPAKATALRLIEGMRGHRPLPKGEPQPRVGIPKMPESIKHDLEAARHWRATVKVLGAVAGWVTLEMARQLEDYAILRADRDRLRADIKAGGRVFEAELIKKDDDDREVLTKSIRRNPLTVLLKEALIEIRLLEVAMGIGPVYRTKVDLSSAQDGSDDSLDA
mgnify:FL=1